MAEPTPRTFSHFARFAMTPKYWLEPSGSRHEILKTWFERLGTLAPAVHRYQAFGVDIDADFMIWCAIPTVTDETAGRYFQSFAAAMAPYRQYLELKGSLWGFTRGSQYTKTRSRQEIDPFTSERAPYLVAYPFTKTSSWYREPEEERRRMMAEHIKLGKQYEDITQLLLYSVGLQDQEFVVVYETTSLERFSALVGDLRMTEGRPYTERDTPLHTAVYLPDHEALAKWL